MQQQLTVIPRFARLDSWHIEWYQRSRYRSPVLEKKSPAGGEVACDSPKSVQECPFAGKSAQSVRSSENPSAVAQGLSASSTGCVRPLIARSREAAARKPTGKSAQEGPRVRRVVRESQEEQVNQPGEPRTEHSGPTNPTGCSQYALAK